MGRCRCSPAIYRRAWSATTMLLAPPMHLPSRVMALSLKPEHLKRYKDIAFLLIQHGRSDFVKAADADLPEAEVSQEVSGDPEKLARDLEELGPTFIKLGQLLSTRSDLLPAPYL